MKYCPHCNAPIHRHTRLCPDCGRPLHGSAGREQTGGGSKKSSSGRNGCIVLIIVLLAFIFIVLSAYKAISGRLREQDRRRERRGNEEQPYHQTTPNVTFTVPDLWGTDSPDSPDSPLVTSTVPKPTASVSIQDYSISDNPFGQSVVTVNLLFSNEGDTPVSFFSVYRAQAFQNGIECRVTFTDVEAAQKEALAVQPGSSLIVPQSFVLNDNSEISLIISSFGFDESTVLEQTLTVAE